MSVASGGRLYVTTPDGEELEIIVPEGVESDEEFDVDMGDVSEESDEEGEAPATAPPNSRQRRPFDLSSSSEDERGAV